jgi:protein-tyrosine-phosphatase
MPPERAARPSSALFACNMNAVRSPMAEALLRQMFGAGISTASVGVDPGDLDPFAVAVMDEVGIDIARHRPVSFEDYEDLEGVKFDLIVTLTPAAHHKGLEVGARTGAAVEYWPMPDPTGVEGNREQRLDAYRALRDQLIAKIRERFGGKTPGNE